MCFHTQEEYDRWRDSIRTARAKAVAAGIHAKSDDKYGLIVLRDAVGEWVAGWHCDPRDPQDVANTIMDLKKWHEGEFKYVDTSDVDKERARLKLAALDQDGLPLPNRLPRESVDKLVEEWDIEHRSAIPAGGLNQISRSVQAKRDAAAREEEVKALAESLGVSMDEIKQRQKLNAALTP